MVYRHDVILDVVQSSIRKAIESLDKEIHWLNCVLEEGMPSDKHTSVHFDGVCIRRESVWKTVESNEQKVQQLRDAFRALL